jgi:hypothetical protein
MINKETYLKGLKLICLDAGLEFSGEKGDTLLKGKVTLFENFLQDFANEDFEKATLEIIRKEIFYNKIPQVKVFIDYCQKEKDKRLSEKKARELEIIKNEKQKLISTIYKFFEISKTEADYLFNSLASELRSYNLEQITQAFDNLKDIDKPQIEDWRKELSKKETTSEAKNWVMPNLKADR